MKPLHRVGLVLLVVAAFQAEIAIAGDYRMRLTDCSQSSVLVLTNLQPMLFLSCEQAIDSYFPSISDKTTRCSHTGPEHGWWSAKIVKRAVIGYVQIYNRKDCCQDRLNDFAISVDGVQCARHQSSTTFLDTRITCNGMGQQIKISSNRKYLTLCEVQVFGQYLNQLPLADCKLSRAFHGSSCANAINGNSLRKGADVVPDRCSHLNSGVGWWSARTLKRARIRAIRILNRDDCCQERLNSFKVTVDGVTCASYFSTSSTFMDRSFECRAVGQEIVISSQREYLTLCKVEVFGEYVDVPVSPLRYLPMDNSCQSGNASQNSNVWSATAVNEADCETRCTDQVECKYYNYSDKECQLSSQPLGMGYRKPDNASEKCAEVCFESMTFCILQRRVDGSVRFDRTWTEYEDGFGDSRNFWTGLRWLHQVTSKSSDLVFRVELTDWAGETYSAEYSGFVVKDASQYYAMDYRQFNKQFSTVYGDSLLTNKGKKFSTVDNDNDESMESCSRNYHGLAGWWFGRCTDCNPNGEMVAKGSNKDTGGAYWFSVHNNIEPLKSILLLIQKP